VSDSVGLGLSGLHFNQPVAVWIELGATKRYANSLVLVNAESLHCGLSLIGLAPGAYDVVEQNFDQQTARLTGGFQVWPKPDVQDVAPQVLGTGSQASVEITGVNFVAGGGAWLTGHNRPPVYASTVQFVSDTELRATFDLTGAAAGTRTVVVQNPGGGTDSL